MSKIHASVVKGRYNMNYIEAKQEAESLLTRFCPLCERIETQGALRRLESDVNEINLLALLKSEFYLENKSSFGVQYLEKLLAGLKAGGAIQYEKLGERSKRFWLNGAGISVQLYLVLPPATWGVRHVVGTGPKDFAHWMVQRQKYGGALPDHCQVQDGAVWDRNTGQKYQTPEEIDFFKLCGLNWIDPQARVAPKKS
jgi:DNA polymerase/3'-5' exonuclease PolX